MLSEPPRCRPVPVRALKGADSPRGLHRGHSPGHMSPPGARSTGGGWLLPASWPDPNSLRQVNPDHDETYRGGNYECGPVGFPGRLADMSSCHLARVSNPLVHSDWTRDRVVTDLVLIVKAGQRTG